MLTVPAVGGTLLKRAAGTTRGFTETADVAAVADPNTGVAVFGPSERGNRSAWLVFGGTSVAAPVIAGIYGINDTAVNRCSDPYQPTANLNDVTSGTNGRCAVSYLCTAVVGYDGPTGLRILTALRGAGIRGG